MNQRKFLDSMADSRGMYIRKQRNGDFYLIDIQTGGMVTHGTMDDLDAFLHDLEGGGQ